MDRLWAEPQRMLAHSQGGNRRGPITLKIESGGLHLIKKALAIATPAIERQPGPFQSTSDQADMKVLVDRLTPSVVPLQHP
jgi:hypothetical protein